MPRGGVLLALIEPHARANHASRPPWRPGAMPCIRFLPWFRLSHVAMQGRSSTCVSWPSAGRGAMIEGLAFAGAAWTGAAHAWRGERDGSHKRLTLKEGRATGLVRDKPLQWGCWGCVAMRPWIERK